MACVDGEKTNNQTTEDDVTPQCSPCKKAGFVLDASNYCLSCKEYMCSSCASIHVRFQEMENHEVVRIKEVSSSESSSVSELALMFCDEHKEKDIEWFCAKHEVMFCDICKRIKHRKCEITALSDMTKVSAQLLMEAMDAMADLKCRIRTLKDEREKSIEDLECLRKSSEEEVKKFKSRLAEMIEQLEKNMLIDINRFVTKEKNVILEHVKTCDDLIPRLETELPNADEIKAAANDVTCVIAAYNFSKTLKELEPTVSELEQEVYSVELSFEPFSTLTDVLAGVDRLGTLNTDRAESANVPISDHPVATAQPSCATPTWTSWSDMEVESSTYVNISTNYITGSAVMADGRIILADYTNQQIVLLDANFIIQSTLKLTNCPRDVAVDGANEVIASIPYNKQLQWINVDGGLTAGRVVTTDLGCWGIALHNDEIYTTVQQGMLGRIFQVMFRSGGNVLVLDRNGKVIRCIGVDANGTGMFIFPNYITVTARGTVFVSDTDQGRITCFTNAGNVVYDIRDTNFSSPRGMLADDNDTLLVGCENSNDIRLMKKDGTYQKIILSSTDGVAKPRAMSYRHTDRTLIVTMDKKPCCRVYKLRYK